MVCFKQQPNLPLGTGHHMVTLTGKYGFLRDDLTTFQTKLDQFELKKRKCALVTTTVSKITHALLFTLCLLCAAISYGLSLSFICVYALWKGYKSIRKKALIKSIKQLELRLSRNHVAKLHHPNIIKLYQHHG